MMQNANIPMLEQCLFCRNIMLHANLPFMLSVIFFLLNAKEPRSCDRQLTKRMKIPIIWELMGTVFVETTFCYQSEYE